MQMVAKADMAQYATAADPFVVDPSFEPSGESVTARQHINRFSGFADPTSDHQPNRFQSSDPSPGLPLSASYPHQQPPPTYRFSVHGNHKGIGEPLCAISNSLAGSPKKLSSYTQAHQSRHSLGKAPHLPFLNLASVKNYSAWPGSPVKPPTPLAVPPTPLTHPSAHGGQTGSSKFLGALKLMRSERDKKSDDGQAQTMHASGAAVHPFALSAAAQPQQYICFNLDVNKGVPGPKKLPLSPPPPPVNPSRDTSSLTICTPSSAAKPAPVPSQLPPKAEAPGAIPTCAKFLADGRLNILFDQQYEILDELGSGGFGFVVRARRRNDGLIVAVKFIFRNRIPSHGWIRASNWSKAADGQPGPERLVPLEAYLLRIIRHPGVVAFLDLIEDESVLYLVMEHHGSPWQPSSPDPGQASQITDNKEGSPTFSSSSQNNSTRENSSPAGPGLDDLPDISFSSDLSTSPTSSSGPPTPVVANMPFKLAPPPLLRRNTCDLFECIEQHSRLPEELARLVFGQIVDVVYYLACMGICHRDIKDENIVVDRNFRVKLIDFGSAIIYDPRKPPPYHNRFFGTVNFAASEILQGHPYRAPHAEVWSLGVLLSILLTGETPFTDPNSAIHGRINKPKIYIPPAAIDLMWGCLDTDPESRLTISQVRDHPWLQFPPSQ